MEVNCSSKRRKKEGQATYIAPLQPLTLATFPSWGIQRELVVQDLPRAKVIDFPFLTSNHDKYHRFLFNWIRNSDLVSVV